MLHLLHAFKKLITHSSIMAENLDIVMSMNNFLEYSKNYRKTTGSLWRHIITETNQIAV